MDSAASHHVTNDLQNLSLYSNYGDPDEVLVGNGTGFTISHTCTTNIISNSHNFKLEDIICAPEIHHNLIYVSKLCRTNDVSVEFFSSHVWIKDLVTGSL